MINEAWAVSSNAGYLGVLDVLLRSLHGFSTRPVIVYGLCCDLDSAAHPNVSEFYRMEDGAHPWTARITNMMDSVSRARRVIFLDADTVANYSIDDLWKWFDWQQKRPDMPLVSEHTVQTNNLSAAIFEQKMGERIGRPFGCTVPMLMTAECLPVLQEVMTLKQRMDDVSKEMSDGDALNAVLARHGMMDNAPYCIPFYGFVRHYMRQNMPSREEMGDAREVYYHMFHGCKDAAEAQEILTTLRRTRFAVHYVEAK
jgi:hypothetical protein